MSWYQAHGESCNYEDLHHPGETHQLLPENKIKNKLYNKMKNKAEFKYPLPHMPNCSAHACLIYTV